MRGLPQLSFLFGTSAIAFALLGTNLYATTVVTTSCFRRLSRIMTPKFSAAFNSADPEHEIPIGFHLKESYSGPDSAIRLRNLLFRFQVHPPAYYIENHLLVSFQTTKENLLPLLEYLEFEESPTANGEPPLVRHIGIDADDIRMNLLIELGVDPELLYPPNGFTHP